MVGTRSFDRQDRYILHPNTSRGGLRGNTSDPDGFVGRYSGLLAPAGRRSSNFDGYSTPGSRYYSVDVSIVGSGYETPASDVADENESIRQSYMSGQIADVLKKSLWWNVVGVLLTYLTKDYYVIPLSHIVLNISFLICSLFSDFLAETMSMRALLCFTVLSRIVIWIFIFPLCYIFFGSYLEQQTLFTCSILVIMALDGFQEALSKACDIARKGLDRLSHNYDIAITPDIHSRMNNLYQTASATSLLLLVLPLLVISYALKYFTSESDLILFSIVLGGTFFILSLMSLCCYSLGLTQATPIHGMLHHDNLEYSTDGLCNEVIMKLGDITDGMMLAISSGNLLKQITFLTLETAFQHSMICFIIPITAFANQGLLDSSLLSTSLICALLLLAEKLGGLLCRKLVSVSSSRNGHSVNTYRTSSNIYRCLILSSISLAILPFCGMIPELLPYNIPLSQVAIGILIFCFSAFSSYPKSAISSCMHASILSHPLSYKIFEFAGVMLIMWDVFLMFSLPVFLNRTVGHFDIKVAYLTIAFFYVLHAGYHIFTGVGLRSLTMEPRGVLFYGPLWAPLNRP